MTESTDESEVVVTAPYNITALLVFKYNMNRSVYVKNIVVRGFGRGSKELGCPTANVNGINHLTIPTGIYCGLAQLVIEKPEQIQLEQGNRGDYERILGALPYISPVNGMVCSFGYNPQYGNKDRSLEVHILDNFKFNFYGAELRVLICKKLREEEKYNSLDELKRAIANDIKNAADEVANYYHLATNDQYFLQTKHNHQHSHSRNNNRDPIGTSNTRNGLIKPEETT